MTWFGVGEVCLRFLGETIFLLRWKERMGDGWCGEEGKEGEGGEGGLRALS